MIIRIFSFVIQRIVIVCDSLLNTVHNKVQEYQEVLWNIGDKTIEQRNVEMIIFQ